MIRKVFHVQVRMFSLPLLQWFLPVKVDWIKLGGTTLGACQCQLVENMRLEKVCCNKNMFEFRPAALALNFPLMDFLLHDI